MKNSAGMNHLQQLRGQMLQPVYHLQVQQMGWHVPNGVWTTQKRPLAPSASSFHTFKSFDELDEVREEPCHTYCQPNLGRFPAIDSQICCSRWPRTITTNRLPVGPWPHKTLYKNLRRPSSSLSVQRTNFQACMLMNSSMSKVQLNWDPSDSMHWKCLGRCW